MLFNYYTYLQILHYVRSVFGLTEKLGNGIRVDLHLAGRQEFREEQTSRNVRSNKMTRKPAVRNVLPRD